MYLCIFRHVPDDGEVYSMQHYAINVVSDLRQVRGFLLVLLFPPLITDHHDITEILLKVMLNPNHINMYSNQSINKINNCLFQHRLTNFSSFCVHHLLPINYYSYIIFFQTTGLHLFTYLEVKCANSPYIEINRMKTMKIWEINEDCKLSTLFYLFLISDFVPPFLVNIL